MSDRVWFPKKYADVVQRLRVPSGFLLLAGFLWQSNPTLGSILAGLPLSIAGLWLRAWAAGHLAKNQQLATSGPYSWVRNPLYLGTLLTAAGVVAASRSLGLALLFAAVFVLVYFPVMEQESLHLQKLFPDYDRYARTVPLLLPAARRFSDPKPFRFELYSRNKEYKAAMGYAAALALMIWKAAA